MGEKPEDQRKSRSVRTQVNFYTTAQGYNDIETLKADLDKSTMSEVIRDAIKTLKALEGLKDENGYITIETKEGKIKIML